MPSGQPITVEINLDQIAYSIPAGNKLRVAISNAYWPLIWPAPERAAITLTAGKITLPLLEEGDKNADRFAPPASAEPQKIETLRESNHIRRQEVDRATGKTCLIIEDDFGEIRDLNHNLINSSIAREKWSIHPEDPLSARGETHWTQELSRDDWHVRTETYSYMHSDAESFYLSARIEAFEGDE